MWLCCYKTLFMKVGRGLDLVATGHSLEEDNLEHVVKIDKAYTQEIGTCI